MGDPMSTRIGAPIALLTPLLAAIAGCGTAGATTPECESSDPLDRAICSTQRFREAVEDDQSSGFSLSGSLGSWQLWAAAVALLIALAVGGKRPDQVPAHRDLNGPLGCMLAAKNSQEKLGGSFAFAAALVLGAWAFGGGGWAVLAAIPAGLIAWHASYRHGRLDQAIAGYRIADQRYCAAADHAQREAAAAPGEFDDLSIGGDIARTSAPVVLPEPHLSESEAIALAQTGGWNPEAGSALAALTDIAGMTGPACAGMDQVARDLGWGQTIQGETGPVWDQFVAVVGVNGIEGGDAVVTLAVSHSRIDETAITRALPALLRAWRCRGGEVWRETATGYLKVTVTNRREAPQQESTSAPRWKF
jgi:hypothetical protein